jgi:DNA-binding ferritin-like protein
MDLQSTLEQTFATNFQVYFRTHSAHVNIVGRNFYSDHKLLQKIYEGLQADADTLGELLRTIQAFFPRNLTQVIADSATDDRTVEGTSEELLQGVYDDMEVMIDQYTELYHAAEAEDHIEISNYAQDQLRVMRKTCWMLRSILENDLGAVKSNLYVD